MAVLAVKGLAVKGLAVKGLAVKGLKEALLGPVLMTALAAAVLFLLGQAPGLWGAGEETPRRFDSIEEAGEYLGFDLVLPSYFPSHIAWPAERISGRLSPAPAAEIVFLDGERSMEALLIIEVDGVGAPAGEDEQLRIESVLQETPVVLRGEQATLTVGKNRAGRVLNGLRWSSGGRSFVVVTVHPIRTLMAIAASMVG